MWHSTHVPPPQVQAAKICSELLPFLWSAILNLAPHSLFLIQPVPAFKMVVKSCLSSVQTHLRASPFHPEWEPEALGQFPALVSWYPIPSLPPSHSILSLAHCCQPPWPLGALMHTNSYLRAFASAGIPMPSAKPSCRNSHRHPSNLYSHHTFTLFTILCVSF